MPKHPGGRPTDYRPEMCDEVLELMYNGDSMQEIARHLRVSRNTIHTWRQKHPEFEDTIKLGKEFSEGWWMAEGKSALRDREFSAALWYMNMKNRHGWRDKFESSHEIAITKVEEESRDNERDCYNEV